MQILLLIGALSIMTLVGPDETLLAADAHLKLPYIGLEVSVASFLVFGPFAILVVAAYLHIAYGRLESLAPSSEALGSDFYVFAIRSPLFGWITSAIFYYFTPLVLGLYAWKASPRPEGVVLAIVAWSAAVGFGGLHLQRAVARKATRSGVARIIPLICVLAAMPAIYSRTIVAELLRFRQLDLIKAPLGGKDLRGVNLSGADLEGADLKNANLQSALLGGVSTPE